MEIIMIIYGICLIPSLLVVKGILDIAPHGMKNMKLMVFLSIWLIMPLFPVWLGFKQLKKKLL